MSLINLYLIATDCTDSAGVKHAEGSRWKDDSNPCRTCHCIDGDERCQLTPCPVRCKYPVPVPGECCPQCTGLSLFHITWFVIVVDCG